MALVLQQSCLTRQDLAQTNAQVEALTKRGYNAGAVHGGGPERRMVTMQAESDKRRVWEHT